MFLRDLNGTSMRRQTSALGDQPYLSHGRRICGSALPLRAARLVLGEDSFIAEWTFGVRFGSSEVTAEVGEELAL